jgi:hypothetical protein
MTHGPLSPAEYEQIQSELQSDDDSRLWRVGMGFAFLTGVCVGVGVMLVAVHG